MNDDLPIIQLPPGPTDAELQAERDAKHAQALDDFEREERYLRHGSEFDIFCGFDHIPPGQVRG